MWLNLSCRQAVQRKLKKIHPQKRGKIVFFFASSLFKSVTFYVIPRMGRNDYLDFQQKARGV